MNDEGKDETAGMEPGDDAALWQLLGRAPGVEVSPYFSRRVLREVAQAEAGRTAGTIGGWLTGLRRMCRQPRAVLWPGVAAVGVFWLSVVLTMQSPVPRGVKYRVHRPKAQVVQEAPAIAAGEAPVSPGGEAAAPLVAEEITPQDVEVIADLDNVIAREENRLWTEDTARF